MPCTLGVLPTSLPMSGTWPPQAAEVFTSACRAHGVPAPEPAPDHDTTSHQYHQAVAPRAPPHILPFCCPRLFLADSANAASDAVGKSCRIGICMGLPCTQGSPGVGHLNGSACGATPLSMRTIRCCKACLQRPCAPHTAPAGLHWIYASSAAAGSAAAVRPQKFSPALANASCSPNQLSLRPTLLRMSRLHPPPQRTTVPHLPTQPSHAKAPLTRWRVGAHIAGFSCLCCMPRSVAFTPMRLMLGKPMLIMHRCGNAPLTFFARPRLCSPLLWCTRCIPCST